MFEQFPLGSNDAPVIAIAKSQAQAHTHKTNKSAASKQQQKKLKDFALECLLFARKLLQLNRKKRNACLSFQRVFV